MSIKEILETYRTIAVVGLSSRAWRPSFSVSRYMQSAGYRIIPVNPRETEVLGERAYPSLADIPEAFEIVDIFRQSEYVPDIVEAAIRRNAERMQEISRYTGSISASVEQQTAATKEISHNVASAADGTKVVVSALEQVTGAVNKTGTSAGTVLSASHAVKTAAASLRETVDGFLRKVAA